MSEIALRTYVEQLDSLIERKQTDEVLAHCRHILGLYPKHLDTYRMLGKALLEKNRHTDAADIFQRVLSVAPDDFISHVGMAIVREDEANLDAAIWHMERAFEASPSNGAIQQELCRLYGRRDGVTPAKARLTRGALARMYSQGGLFLQAEAELKSALAEDPERVDLLTVLARVYWQSGQPAEAAQACAGILQKLPYSIEANRILSAVFREQGRGAEAAAYRQRLEALDPYEAFIEPGRNGASAHRVEAGKVTLQRLDYVPGTDDSGSPDWLTSIGAQFEEPKTQSSTATPDWLGGEAEAPISPADMPAAAELPDWLRDLQPQAPAGDRPAEPGSGTPDWLNSLGVTDASLPSSQPANEDLPEWLRTATGPLESEAVPDWMVPAFKEPATRPIGEVAEPADDEEGLPDWLASLTLGAAGAAAAAAGSPDKAAEQPSAEAAGEAAALDEGELPAWMRPAAEAAPAEDEVPDWMRPAAEATVVAIEPQAEGEAPAWTQPAGELQPEDELPEWMRPVEEAPTEPGAALSDSRLVETSEGAVQTAALGDTLIGMQPAVPEAEEPAALRWPEAEAPAEAGDEPALAQADIPDWLKPAQPANSAMNVLEPGEDVPEWLRTAAGSDMGTADLPEWMRVGPPLESSPPEAPAPPAVPAEVDEETLAWLQSAAAEAKLDEAQTQAPQASGMSSEAPDWLRKPPAEAEGPAPLAVPDWLRDVAASAPQPNAEAEREEPGAESIDDVRDLPGSAPLPELPDYLQPASAEAIARAEQPFQFDAAEAYDEDFAEEPDEPDLVLPADIPEWLRAMAPISPDPEAAATSQAEPAPASDEPKSVVSAIGMETAAPIEQDETPAWLADLSAAGTREEVAPWIGDATEQTAEAAAADSLVVPASEADLAQADAIELPPWAQTEEPGPTDTIASWLKAKDAHEWLRAGEAEGMPLADEAVSADKEPMPPASEESVEPVSSTVSPTPEAATDLPPWAQAESPGATDTIVSWLSGKDRQAGAPEQMLPAEPDMPQAEAAPAEPAAMMAEEREPTGQSDIGVIDEDEALRWMESLAAQHGARPEELITAPEDRPTETPGWIAAQQGDAGDLSMPAYVPPEGEEPAPAGMLATDEAERQPAAPSEASEPVAAMLAEGAPSLEEWFSKVEQAMPADELADTAPTKLPLPTIGEPIEEMARAAMEEPASLKTVQSEAAQARTEPGELEADEALRWMEGLAARQGAKPEELITEPEDRPAETPAWLKALTGAEAQLAQEWAEAEGEDQEVEGEMGLAEAEAADEALAADLQVDLAALAGLAALVPGEPEGMPAAVEAERPAEVEAPAAELEADDEAMRWLEGLAARQGALADELMTAPEDRVTDTPAWIAAQAEQEAEPEPLPEPEPAEAFAPPEWLPAEAEAQLPAEVEPQAAEAAPQSEPQVAQPSSERPQTGDLDRLARLAERLAATRREREAEIEARFAEQRAEQAAARRLVQERLEARRVEPEAAARATGPLAQPQTAAPSPAAQAADQDLSAAAERYSTWVASGEHLDQAIREMEALVHQAKPTAPVLRVLGDAYARQDRLAEALDAYRMALERI